MCPWDSEGLRWVYNSIFRAYNDALIIFADHVTAVYTSISSDLIAGQVMY